MHFFGDGLTIVKGPAELIQLKVWKLCLAPAPFLTTQYVLKPLVHKNKIFQPKIGFPASIFGILASKLLIRVSCHPEKISSHKSPKFKNLVNYPIVNLPIR